SLYSLLVWSRDSCDLASWFGQGHQLRSNFHYLPYKLLGPKLAGWLPPEAPDQQTNLPTLQQPSPGEIQLPQASTIPSSGGLHLLIL
ncbi:hypothetical protein ILYODFUR_034870, partial [Ilyodon furcidens]